MRHQMIFILIFVLSSMGCSVYQSDGREFLESRGFDFALQGSSVAAIQKLDECAEVSEFDPAFFEKEGFELLGTDENGFEFWRYESKNQKVSLAVHLENQQRHFICEKVYADREALDRSFHSDTNTLMNKISVFVGR